MSRYTKLDGALRVASTLVRLGIPEDKIDVAYGRNRYPHITLWVKPSQEECRRALDALGTPTQTRAWTDERTHVEAQWVCALDGVKLLITWPYYGSMADVYENGYYVRTEREQWNFQRPSSEDADALADIWLAGRTD